MLCPHILKSSRSVHVHCRCPFLCTLLFFQELDISSVSRPKICLMVPSCCIICLMCTGHLITTTHDKLFRKNSCFHHVYICHNTEFMVLPIIIAQQNSCHGTVNSMRKIMVKQSINSPSLDADKLF